jgi:hypothetical protein
MRRLVFILMIALLPLRGWMGEAMATEMAAMYFAATPAKNTSNRAIFDIEIGALNFSTISSGTGTPMAAMPADCEMHAKSETGVQSSRQLCSHCQACHAVGLAGTVKIISKLAPYNPVPAAHVSLFASAKVALSQKPPIL